ncbi:ribosome biogenesis GTPase Der [Pantoea sp. Aalb]|uniref:ribosome biogenesis GTPase Der n=1 Tax=Pantoea sp. Aalb TaxID=2576762 RepID=UPI00132C62BB|nr:ribosome biogenesis GTPase Der [Pantoea sp. Aalb]MXP67262.1 ribosome biogenesis GTPase Der [Pantoea sp. Aalb]
MVVVVVIVGHSNVGKSTLFNTLTRTRDAIVADFPGLTRDRIYGLCKIQGRKFILIDTSGIDNTSQNNKNISYQQSLLAIKEADIVLFMVDARIGLISADYEIAKYLRLQNKIVFLIANKIDGMNLETAMIDYHALGLGKIYPITALHNRGIIKLLETDLLPYIDKISLQISSNDLSYVNWKNLIAEKYHKSFNSIKISQNDNIPIKLAIIGRPNVGKSTLINCMLGEERVTVYDIPGTTRDSVYIPMKRYSRQYILIDTAGVRKRSKISNIVEKFSVMKTLKAIESANVVILVIDAYEGVLDQDLSLLNLILNHGRALVIVINKWDILSKNIQIQIKKTINLRFSFINFANIHFISALHGLGIDKLFKLINKAYDDATKHISTALLTRIMNMAVNHHQPPLVHNRRRVKLKYAHSGGYNPPTIVIHGNQLQDLSNSYKRYLINYFRDALNIIGTPIRISFKESINPYAAKRNILTPNQQRKRKRLIKYVKNNKH